MDDSESDRFANLGNLVFDIWGQVTAQQLILRFFLTQRALDHDDPIAWAEEMRSGLIQSMAQIARLDDPVEHRVIEGAESQIDDIFDNVITRLKSMETD